MGVELAHDGYRNEKSHRVTVCELLPINLIEGLLVVQAKSADGPRSVA